MFWTQERVNLTVMMINEKSFSCGMVARELGTTRNAVISKVHRLMRHGAKIHLWPIGFNGLRGKNKWRLEAKKKSLSLSCENINTRKRKVVTPNGNVREVTVNSAVGRVLLNQRVTKFVPAVAQAVFDLRPGQCRWPIGELDAPGFMFCQNDQLPDLSYCSCHCIKSFEYRSA